MSNALEDATRAILVTIDFGDSAVGIEESMTELHELATTAGAQVVGHVQGRRARADSKWFAGSGKVDEVGMAAREADANLVIFNHALSPAQERNLSTHLEIRTIDRTSLILDIFAQRARSYEGQLQVELAQLAHMATRLVRSWTHLERQKGGIGLRGPGETQLETDRQLLRKRVKLLKERLAKVHQQRAVQRRARQRRAVFSVSIVGYTNAGKSTLFNRLTRADTYVADQLFATLDTTSRKLFLDEDTTLVLSDTVGFIRQLPHSLIAAFRSTLEETLDADLLLHVVDDNHPCRDQQILEVNRVLAEIGAANIPQLRVYNKVDQQPDAVAGTVWDDCGRIQSVRLSARTGAGVDPLRKALCTAAHAASTRVHPIQSDWSPLDE